MSNKSILTKIIYNIETCIVKAIFFIFKFLGIKISSFICGVLAVVIGPFTPPTRLIFKNLKLALPEKTFLQRFIIMIGIWNNLGRVIGEFPNIYKKSYKILDTLELDNNTKKNIEEVRNLKTGAIFFSGHFANWEVGIKTLLENNMIPSVVYRPMNNYALDKYIIEHRENYGVKMIHKGVRGVFELVKDLEDGKKIVIMADQRLKNGIDIPFLGVNAKTTDSIAAMSIKYNLPIYPCRIIRKGFSSNFKLILEDKIKYNLTNDLNKDKFSITCLINKELENWIKDIPSQWFWVHDRWKK